MNRWFTAEQNFEATSSLETTRQRINSTIASVQSGVCHAIFAPLHYEPNYAYPLVVWLHGSGEDERQLNAVMPHVSLRNYVAIAPRGTRANVESDEHRLGYSWFQQPDDILLAEHRVGDCVGLARRRFNIHPERIFLVGYDHGGTMALRVGLAKPEVFAGIVSIAGKFPVGHSPLVQIKKARSMPLLLTHGRQSETYSEDDVCRDLKLVHSAGMPVTLRQYPGADEITTKILRDVDAWLMEQVTGVRGSSPSEDVGRREFDRN
jgi:phospholipase/carboxylesterase